MNTATRNYLWFVIFLVLVGSAFLLPRLVAGNETGLAAGATGALTFLACFAAAGVLGVVLLVLTIRSRATLPAGAKIAGFLPLPILAVGLLVIVLLALQKQREHQASEPPPKTLTPTATPTP